MKCDKCDGTGDISVCVKCNTEKIDAEYYIKNYSGDNEYGPYCYGCIGSMIPEKVLHSHDLTERHNMDKLLHDSRTRPTDPPKPGDFPNPRCEEKDLNGYQCVLHLNHKLGCRYYDPSV